MSKRIAIGTIVFIGLAGLIGAACGGGGGGATAPAPAGAAGVAGSPAAREPLRAGQAGPADEAKFAPAGVPDLGPRVVKTASLTLRLKDGAFDQRFQEATQVAARYGGFVSSSQSAEGKHRSGTLVLRVPADQFESALGALKGLGSVREERVTGQDVTAQFVDLQARLRNWEAQEDVLLKLMAKATSIEDSIRVQRELQDVQLTIEELRGQLRVLSDQADLSTITVSMAEAGFVAPKAKEGSALSRAWHDAVDGFVGVIAAVIVGLGYLVPLVMLAGIAWLGLRRLRPKVARPA